MENTTTHDIVDNIPDKKSIMKKINRRYSWCWNTLLIQIVIGNAIILSLGFLLPTLLNKSLLEVQMTIAAVAYLIANPLSAAIGLKVTKAAKFGDLYKKPNMSIPLIILAVLATLGISGADSIIMQIFKTIFSASNEEISEAIGSGILSDNIILSVISIAYVALLGPCAEELLCRGAIQSMGSHISPRFGIFISAFIFGVFHMNISQFYNAFLLGLLLGYVTYKSGSIIPSSIMHIANNSLVVIEMLIIDKMPEDKAAALIGGLSVGTTVIGIIALIIFIVVMNKKKNYKGKAIVNAPVTEEEISSLSVSKARLTAVPLFTRVAFFIVMIIFVLSCLSINMNA